MDVDEKKTEETPVPATNGDAPASEEKTEPVVEAEEKKVEETTTTADAPAEEVAPAEEAAPVEGQADAKADEDMAPATSETVA